MLLEPCSDRLTSRQRERFATDGYLALRGLLAPAEIASACAAIRDLAERASEAEDVLAQVEPGHEPQAENLEARLRKLMNLRANHAAVAAIAEQPRLTGLVEQLLGAPVECFQDMALIKPPHIGSEKPWHQDAAYFDVVPLAAVVGVWIALDEATAENGCMHVIPGAHRTGPRHHVLAPVLVPDPSGGPPRRSQHTDCQLEGFDPAGAVPVPLPPGGVLLFSPLLPHQTPPNRSERRRRALQLHYRTRASRRVDRETYAGVFVGPDGRPGACPATA